MKAEIISIGTELLLGKIVDTNAAWLSTELTQIGIDCHFKTTVGDNLANMVSVLNIAKNRSDIIICTGGLGPTQDDITKEALSEVLNKPLIFNESLATKIQDKFKARQITMSQNNIRQAYYPEGASILETFPGTAPGIFYQSDTHLFFLLPGVPHEMKVIFSGSILTILKHKNPNHHQIFTETIRVWGAPESDISEMIADIDAELSKKGNPKLSYLASGINGISVNISAKSKTEKEANAMLLPYLKKIKEKLSPYIYGFNKETMEQCVITLCRKHNLTLSTLESFSGGMIASRLLSHCDSNGILLGGMVSPNVIDQKAFENNPFKSDILIGVSQLSEETTDQVWALELHLKILSEYKSHLIKIPKHQREEAMAFSVIYCLNFLRKTLNEY